VVNPIQNNRPIDQLYAADEKVVETKAKKCSVKNFFAKVSGDLHAYFSEKKRSVSLKRVDSSETEKVAQSTLPQREEKIHREERGCANKSTKKIEGKKGRKRPLHQPHHKHHKHKRKR